MKTHSRVALMCVLILAGVIIGPYAQAHNRSQSFSSWSISGAGVQVLFTAKSREVTRLPPLEGNLRSLEKLLAVHIRQTLRVDTEQGPCPAQGVPTPLPAAPGYVRISWAFECPTSERLTARIDSFFAVAPGHVHYARMSMDEGLPEEFLFTENLRDQELKRQRSGLDSFYRSFVQYMVLGIEHILGGADHIAFLIALLLLIRHLREVLWMVSGFTVGHSITLSLAALGLVVPEVSAIEALIGFTIALVATENIGAITGTNRQLGVAVSVFLVLMALISILWGGGLPVLGFCGLFIFTLAYLPLSDSQKSAVRMRPLLTLAFGLVHGFGFASVLTEVGLPQQRLVPALAGFNVGVELGQVLIVSGAWFLAHWIYRNGLIRSQRAWLDTSSAVICGLGFYWFVSRSLAQLQGT